MGILKYKVIENPTETEILRKLGGKYNVGYSRDDVFPVRNFYPMWKMYNMSIVEPWTEESILLGCNYTPGINEADANYLGWLILEKEDGPLKLMLSGIAPPLKYKNGFRYDCQVYGHRQPFEVTFDFKESVVHQLAMHLAFGINYSYYWGHKYANLFKARDFLNTKFNDKEFLAFCDIIPSRMAGGSYGFNDFACYFTEAKGIKLSNYRSEIRQFITWTELAAALTDLLKVEVKTEIKQTPLF